MAAAVSRVWTAIVLSGAGTFAMRASFISAAHHLATVPPAVQRVLRQIPPAALAALVVPAMLRPEGSVDLTHPRLWAGVLAGLVAWRTRNVALTLVVGMTAVFVLERL
jgi:branched-subunit amino acid transport protein